jgi:PleD family two-component response regulator
MGIRKDGLMNLFDKFNSTTILIVDDDPSIIMAISKALDGFGRIVFAIDGASALKLITEWQHANWNAQLLSLLMLDIDEFKKYNDHFGHLNGDNRIKNFAARYGGEECVIILSDTEITGVHLLGENIVKNIIKQAIPHAPDAESQIVTLPIGCCTYSSSTKTPAQNHY